MVFKRLKRNWRGRRKGDVFQSKKKVETLKDRTLFLVKKKRLLKTCLKEGTKSGDEAKVKTSGNLGEYKDVGCPGLFPAKEAQRKDLIKNVEGGTVLELYGGRGHLTQTVYAKKMDKAVLVDSDKKALSVADQKLDGKIKHEVVLSDNVKWLENEMTPSELKNLKVVDFDAFGSPAEPVKTFFDNYPVKHSIFVALTDGSKRYLGYVDGREGRQWLKEHYGVDLKSDGTREEQVKILDTFMKKQGTKHGFNVTPVNLGFGRSCAIYAGYKITPK